jgi:hypothetical protein
MLHRRKSQLIHLAFKEGRRNLTSIFHGERKEGLLRRFITSSRCQGQKSQPV